jgi:hypothetical protein
VIDLSRAEDERKALLLCALVARAQGNLERGAKKRKAVSEGTDVFAQKLASESKVSSAAPRGGMCNAQGFKLDWVTAGHESRRGSGAAVPFQSGAGNSHAR